MRGFVVIVGDTGQISNRNQLASVLVAVIFISVVALIFFHASVMPLFGDYSEWTYHGLLLRDVFQGHPDANYVLKNYPVPNSLSTIGLGLLMLLLPWKIAAKVWLICGACLGVFAALRLERASGTLQGWKQWVVPAAMVFGITFWAGFTDFNFGTYFAMLICASLFKRTENPWLYTVIFLLAFFSHMIPFGFAVLVFFFYILQNKKWRLIWPVVPTLLLSLWYFAGRFSHGDVDDYRNIQATVPYRQFFWFIAYKVNSYLKCWGFTNPASGPHDSILLRLAGEKIFLLLFLACCVLAAGIFILMFRTGWHSIRTRGDRSFFWIALGLFFIVGLALPGAAAGVSDPGGRMIEVASWSGLCVIATRRIWAEWIFAICALLLMVSNFFLIDKVAMKPPMGGTVESSLPVHLTEFGHIYYSARYFFCVDMDRGNMSEHLFPTAMFLEKNPQQNKTTK